MNARAATIASNLADHFAPNHRLLEIGAGKGHVALALRQATRAQIHLVDVVDYNETELPLDLYDGLRLPYDDDSFDYSLLVFVLHHTPDPLLVLREALRVSLRGVFVIENHVPERMLKPVTRFFDSIPHYQHGVPVCYHTFASDEWIRLFNTLPVHAVPLGRFNMGFFWRNFVVRLDKHRAGGAIPPPATSPLPETPGSVA